MKSAEIFCAALSVDEGDIDALGHASNLAFIRWIQDVTLAHASALGLDLGALRRIGGLFVVVRQEVDYLRPALRGDAVEARTWICTFMAAKCVRATEFVRRADGLCLARARTTWGFVDAVNGRPMRIPREVSVRFAPFVHGEGASLPRPGPDAGRDKRAPDATPCPDRASARACDGAQKGRAGPEP
jgi:acyl-CoA thioester hydrolase